MEEKKRRRALTDADRLMIRKHNQTHPLAQQKDLANWFTVTVTARTELQLQRYNGV